MRQFYNKPDDAAIRVAIEEVIKIRPTYGYKRITAMINRERERLGLSLYNKKRILRVMQKFNLILPRALVTRPSQRTGKVMTLASDTRWCSDCFEIKCFSGEKVYVAFALDTHDREAIEFIAKESPIHAQDIQDLMVLCVEKRFGIERNSGRPIEWLSDRGSIYRAEQTKQVARKLGLLPRFTMAYSPESNGMAEAFVNTIKRDYVYVNDCVTAEAVLKLLPGWITDYNTIAPHSALGMMSPIQYRLTKAG